jgi:hypothetical protein
MGEKILLEFEIPISAQDGVALCRVEEWGNGGLHLRVCIPPVFDPDTPYPERFIMDWRVCWLRNQYGVERYLTDDEKAAIQEQVSRLYHLRAFL